MKLDLKNKKKLVIKIGSSLLVEGGKLREKWLKNFAKNVADLIAKDFQITIVSAGAIALGRGFLKVSNKKLSLEEKQAAAAIGQIQLMSFYRDFFKKLNLVNYISYIAHYLFIYNNKLIIYFHLVLKLIIIYSKFIY